MKEKIEPYCKFCQNEMCVYAECPACCDYCPVPNLPGVCRFEIRENMTPVKAWGNIADRLKIYAEEHGFTDEDVAAEVMAKCFAGGHLRYVDGEWRDDDGRTVDAVEVVRCKDCMMFCPQSDPIAQHCFVTGNIVSDDDFCSFGERREDNAAD